MHTQMCETCRARPAAWKVELDADLDDPERVVYVVCDGCVVGVKADDPNLTLSLLQEDAAMFSIEYGTAETQLGTWIGFIKYSDGEIDMFCPPSHPNGFDSRAEAHDVLMPMLRDAVMRSVQEEPGVELIDVVQRES